MQGERRYTANPGESKQMARVREELEERGTDLEHVRARCSAAVGHPTPLLLRSRLVAYSFLLNTCHQFKKERPAVRAMNKSINKALANNRKKTTSMVKQRIDSRQLYD
eukprot:SAG22_NODE_3812_length_1519_cov_1.821831_2_plen_108_part_00